MGELDGFDQFWSVYPRRVAKLAAVKMYKRALKLTTPEVILAAAKKYAAERQGKDATFTAHPATWLNAGRWDDYQAELSLPPSNLFYAKFTSRELEAWTAYGKSIGKSYPHDRAGGWYFPTRWPPDYVEHETAA